MTKRMTSSFRGGCQREKAARLLMIFSWQLRLLVRADGVAACVDTDCSTAGSIGDIGANLRMSFERARGGTKTFN